MLIEAREVEFSSDEKQDDTHGFKASISACFALGGLKQAVDSLDESVGLARLSPGNNAVEVSANQSRDVLHRFDLRTHDVAPLLQHLRHDINLLALENVAQLLTSICTFPRCAHGQPISPGFRPLVAAHDGLSHDGRPSRSAIRPGQPGA
jgi:hypothetical protein